VRPEAGLADRFFFGTSSPSSLVSTTDEPDMDAED